MTKVRTTINPTVELDVDDRELRDLTLQGLVLDTKATTEGGLEDAARRQLQNRNNDENKEG